MDAPVIDYGRSHGTRGDHTRQGCVLLGWPGSTKATSRPCVRRVHDRRLMGRSKEGWFICSMFCFLFHTIEVRAVIVSARLFLRFTRYGGMSGLSCRVGNPAGADVLTWEDEDGWTRRTRLGQAEQQHVCRYFLLAPVSGISSDKGYYNIRCFLFCTSIS